MKANNSTSLFQKDQVIESLKQSFVKLNPKTLIKNPVMFTVEVSTFFMLLVTIYSAFSNTQGSFVYNLLVFVILFITILFGSFLLDDNGAIQVFAALGRQIDALRFEHRQNTRQHSRGGFHAAVLANMPANDLAGRAADHKNIPGAQVCSRQQFFRRLACLRRNGGAIRFLNGVLFHNLPTFFIY